MYMKQSDKYSSMNESAPPATKMPLYSAVNSTLYSIVYSAVYSKVYSVVISTMYKRQEERAP